MALTDRQAADMRASKAVGEAHGRVALQVRARAGDGLALRNALTSETAGLSKRLIEIYSELPGASEPPLRDELVAAIQEWVSSFIKSVAAAQRVNVGAVARLAGC